jgi:hypothetical protein
MDDERIISVGVDADWDAEWRADRRGQVVGVALWLRWLYEGVVHIENYDVHWLHFHIWSIVEGFPLGTAIS